MKYLKSLAIILVPILLLSFLTTTLYYFNLLGTGTTKTIKLAIPILSLFLGGLYLGKQTQEKGWLEGLKLGSAIILLMFIVSYLAFDIGFSIKGMIYYFLILLTTTFGSMIGIRNVENEKSSK